MDDSPSRQIRIRFITKLLPPLRMSTTDFEIPADLSRMKLSDIVNRVLAVEPNHKAQPFDLVVAGDLVQMRLQHFLDAKGTQPGKMLELEYVEAVPPMKPEDFSQKK